LTVTTIMKILIMKVSIYIPYSNSLKEKRSIVKAVKDKIWSKFRASIAEIEAQDSPKTAVIGISYVSNDKALLSSISSKIVNFIDQSYPGLLEDHRHIIEDY
jgi:uncharacterized protein YlxP (DUF503 family)